MLGVSTYWRAGGGDTYTPGRASLHALIKSVDVIMPWYVGRFNDINSYNTGWVVTVDLPTWSVKI